MRKALIRAAWRTGWVLVGIAIVVTAGMSQGPAAGAFGRL
jgi:hypothetical protein